eukprot:NODE_4919_length_616_cov_89.333333_g4235_i0.p1 GENE.NODE_4919_length_616_cov_89.333333_g4235_i0~~NODE_4919_length_616_cov_89.333333_g4235_i0.p1  ORF type:complete len:82 (+),score=4.36 NODE_4919_length_616_cov_89.333333_g4235_i0:172-417(+)
MTNLLAFSAQLIFLDLLYVVEMVLNKNLKVGLLTWHKLWCSKMWCSFSTYCSILPMPSLINGGGEARGKRSRQACWLPSTA